jgi:8-oxo-dGTP diphosphatase
LQDIRIIGIIQGKDMIKEVHELYGNRVRVRACGLLVQDESLLMVNHRSLADSGFWAPPGGGVDFGESAVECLQREFLEETGLEIQASNFLFAYEFIKPPLHAIELFFRVNLINGILMKGEDPEMKPHGQIIEDVKFLSWKQIKKMKPSAIHGVFRLVPEPANITQLTGFLRP